jgi:hypothetical protein
MLIPEGRVIDGINKIRVSKMTQSKSWFYDQRMNPE